MLQAKMGIRGKMRVTAFRFPVGEEERCLLEKDSIEKKLMESKKFLEKFQNKKELKAFYKKYNARVSKNHNIVTDEGDAYVADLMANTPTRTKITASAGYMPVGTNWTGTTPKANTWVNTITGSAQALTAGYPQVQGAWGAANDNVVLFRAIYAAGAFGSVTITEAAITSHATDVAANSLLAYAQVTPSVAITASDTLQIDWALTVLGT